MIPSLASILRRIGNTFTEAAWRLEIWHNRGRTYQYKVQWVDRNGNLTTPSEGPTTKDSK